jgi:arylsulfatase A-like enzyme
MPRRQRGLVGTAVVALILASCGLLTETATATTASGAPPTATVARAAAAARPNVLNIVLDDMRDQSPAQIAAYMPKTARWLSSGTFFANADVSTPSCCPARATGMTGQYDHNNLMMHQHDVANFNTATTMQRFLHQGGYQTALVGKYLHEWALETAPPDFDYYAMWQSAEYNSPRINVMGKTAKVTGYATTLAGNYALQYLKKMAADPQGRPWYEYVAVHAPHPQGSGTYTPEAKYASAPVPACGLAQPGEADLTDKPPYAKWVKVTDALVQATCQGQMRVLMSVDDQIDRLLTYLQSSGQLSNTMVVFWSDNGTLWGEHNRVSKFLPYSPAINVPMWLRWDGHVAAGTSADLVSNVDIAPTVYQATTISPPASVVIDGHSLLARVDRPIEFNEYWLDTANGNVPDWAEVHDTHKAYIETYSSTGALAFQEYYNLDNDPGQTTNLLKDASKTNDPPASVITGLHNQVTAYRTCAGATCP